MFIRTGYLRLTYVFPIIPIKVLDSQSVVQGSKLLGGSKVNAAFHPSEVD